MEVTLKRERPTLTVNIDGDEQKHIPLTFNRREFETLGRAEDQTAAIYDFFAKYLGDVFEELGDDDLMALFDGWQRAREALGEPALGESSASPNS